MQLKPDELLATYNYCFAGIHFLYFVIYTSRYSTLHQQIASINKLRKARMYEEAVIDAQVARKKVKIHQMKRIAYFPAIGIALTHLGAFLLFTKFRGEDLLSVLYIFIGAMVLLFLANLVKGAQIFDPNKRFNPTNYRN